MELRAAIEGLRYVPPPEPVVLITDSTYLLNGATRWLVGWQRRNWQTRDGTPVLNQDLWQALTPLLSDRITWQHVRGHTGHPANERANTIAQAHAARRDPGPPLHHQDVAPAPAAGSPPALSNVQRPAAVTYLSLVGGVLQRHPTWEDCRARVHGVPNARYKKCTSVKQEIDTVTGWGLSAQALLTL
jgi:ribonuclease HI